MNGTLNKDLPAEDTETTSYSVTEVNGIKEKQATLSNEVINSPLKPVVVNGINRAIADAQASSSELTTHTNGINGSRVPTEMSRVFILTAKDEEACRKMVSNLKDYLSSLESEPPHQVLSDLAFTLSERRSNLPWVAAHSASDFTDLTSGLAGGKFQPVRTSAKPRIGLVFNGQGAQWHAMGRELMHLYPVFKSSIIAVDGYIKDLGADWSLLGEWISLCPNHVCAGLITT